MSDSFTKNPIYRFNKNIENIIPSIINLNEDLHNRNITSVHPRITKIALKFIVEDITIENTIKCYEHWDNIINNDINPLIVLINHFESKYPIKLTFFRELLFDKDNETISYIKHMLVQNIISLIRICCSYIKEMRDPIKDNNLIIYSNSYEDHIDIGNYIDEFRD